MNTVITHFHNEEYLLPWWINHHKQLFDYGIMINYASTDRSVEICKALCPPHWLIVDSVNHYFDAKSNDAEVKMYEKSVEGFKMTLTTTEFLLIPNHLNHLADFMTRSDINYVATCGVCMVDMYPEQIARYDTPLFKQKHHGMIRGYVDPCMDIIDNFYIRYGRYFHNKPYGHYLDGRHYLNDVGEDKIFLCSELFILKYKYAPWNDAIINRLYTYENRLKLNNSHQSISSTEKQIEIYNHFLTTAHDLNDDPDFKKAFDYCNGVII